MVSLPACLVLCWTWVFCQMLSRFPSESGGLWRWRIVLMQMKSFRENLIFKVRIFIKIQIYYVTWFYVFKFCHFKSGQIMWHLLSSSPSSTDTCGWLKDVIPKFWILMINSDLFWKKWLVENVIFLLHFQNFLPGLFFRSISFSTSMCSVASCFSWLPASGQKLVRISWAKSETQIAVSGPCHEEMLRGHRPEPWCPQWEETCRAQVLVSTVANFHDVSIPDCDEFRFLTGFTEQTNREKKHNRTPLLSISPIQLQ